MELLELKGSGASKIYLAEHLLYGHGIMLKHKIRSV